MSKSAIGRATSEGTDLYRSRISSTSPDYFQRFGELWISSIGLGTHLGDPNPSTDRAYRESLELAVSLGCNMFDTAPNYRLQRSERMMGESLQALFSDKAVAREEIVVSTKVGFVPYEGGVSDTGRQAWIERELINPGIVSADEIYHDHALSRRYLSYQLDRSLANLKLRMVDIYYLHNPEVQRRRLDQQAFIRLLEDCFEQLEEFVDRGLIASYGIATWHGCESHGGSPVLEIDRLATLAARVGGPNHHFRAIQLPINLALTDSILDPVQSTNRTAVDVAADCGLSVFASASLHQGTLKQLPREFATVIPGLRTDAQRALQFTRSLPGVTAALVGMRSTAHVRENLELRFQRRMLPSEYAELFS